MSWYRNKLARDKGNPKRTPTADTVESLLNTVAASSSAKSQKWQPLHDYQVFSKLYWEQGVKEEVNRRWAALQERIKNGDCPDTYVNANGETVKIHNVAFRNTVLKELLRDASEERKDAVRAEMQRERESHEKDQDLAVEDQEKEREAVRA